VGIGVGVGAGDGVGVGAGAAAVGGAVGAAAGGAGTGAGTGVETGGGTGVGLGFGFGAGFGFGVGGAGFTAATFVGVATCGRGRVTTWTTMVPARGRGATTYTGFGACTGWRACRRTTTRTWAARCGARTTVTVTCGLPRPATTTPGSVTEVGTRCGSRICSARAIGSSVVRVAPNTTAAGATRSGTTTRRTRAH
jgi:hypothetical protein